METTQRQTEILDKLIQEYIDSARPVSSQLLEKKYDLSICPAMIRIEMQKLTDQGFIHQPHTWLEECQPIKVTGFLLIICLPAEALAKAG